MKKFYLFIVCIIFMMVFTGCQDKSSIQNTTIPKIKFDESSISEKDSSVSVSVEISHQLDEDSSEDMFDIPETESYAFDYSYSASMGGMVVTYYYKESPKVRIPSELEGETVVGVDFEKLDKEITYLQMPDTVKKFVLSPTIKWHSIIFCVKAKPIRQKVACKASII